MDRQKIIEAAVSDAIIGRPISFELDKKKYEIHPPTLGKMQILSKLYLQLDIDEKNLAKEPHLEAMRRSAPSCSSGIVIRKISEPASSPYSRRLIMKIL